MFRGQVLRRGFSIWRGGSGVVRSAARNGHQRIQVQRVRIRKPFITRSRIIGLTFTATTTYAVLHWLDRWLDELEEEDEEKEGDEEWETVPHEAERDMESEREDKFGDSYEEEELEPILFIPTGLSRPKPRVRYTSSDPEYQEYLRLSSNRQRVRRIQKELVQIIRILYIDNWGAKSPIGDVDPQSGNFMLHLVYPRQPPVEYERPGFEILEDLSVQRSTRPVEEAHHYRLASLLRPVPSAYGVYAHIKQTVAGAWDGVRSSLGLSTQDGAQSEQATTTVVPGQAAFVSSKSTMARDPPTGRPAASSEESTASPSTESTEAGPRGDTPTRNLLIPLSEIPRLDLGQFRKEFKQEFARHIKKQTLQKEPQRGAVVVRGEIEIRGSRGCVVAFVTAHYDLKKNAFVGIIIWRAQRVSNLYSSTDGP